MNNRKNFEKKDFKFTIRNLTTNDLEQYNDLLRYAFQVTEHDLMKIGWRNEEIKQSKFPVLERANILGCYDGETLVSQFAVYPLQMNIYNKIYSVGFITSVSTYPEYSGKGIMSKLMFKSLCQMREKKQSLALLYPYSIPLYRKFGWEIVSNKISFSVKDTQIPTKSKVFGFVRRVDWNNNDFIDLHTQFAKQTHGCLLRNNLAWDEYWRWDEDDTAVAIYYNTDANPLGYMVYIIKDDIMYIKEMIYLNREGQKGLWEYIHAHDSMIDEVRGNTYFNETIAFDMEDGDIKETIKPYIMGRIIDIDYFFSDYKCSCIKDSITISFEIIDEFLPWNNKSFNILFQNEKCYFVNEKSKYKVKMTINTLTTLLLGYKTANQLHQLERIEADDISIQYLDKAILHQPPYISDYI